MVAHAVGRLGAQKLVSLWGIPELRFIQGVEGSVAIGAGSTFRDLRGHAAIKTQFPLLAKASSWIGSIANQSRATIGGNLVNGSPAADSSPVLLVYDAEIELSRCAETAAFHIRSSTPGTNGMQWRRRTALCHSSARRFGQHRQYLRKVGTRRAMAISKVELARLLSSKKALSPRFE